MGENTSNTLLEIPGSTLNQKLRPNQYEWFEVQIGNASKLSLMLKYKAGEAQELILRKLVFLIHPADQTLRCQLPQSCNIGSP